MLELNRGVVNLETVVEQFPDRLKHRLIKAVLLHYHVSGEGDHPASDGPNVEVVYKERSWNAPNCTSDLVHIDVSRRAFHQDGDGLL